MTLGTRVIAEAATLVGVLPLGWLVTQRLRGRAISSRDWWLAAALAVSWIADLAAHAVGQDGRLLISLIYPISQAGLVGVALLDRSPARLFVALLLCVGLVAMLLQGQGPHTPDVVLRTVAWGSVTWLAWNDRELGRMRIVLLTAFGVALLAWYGYVASPGWTSYLVYQSVRLVAALAFCWAVSVDKPLPATLSSR